MKGKPDGHPLLFADLGLRNPVPEVGRPDRPLWTEHKARLISEYLFLFTQVTKHGFYIDGFAGPQYPGKDDAWAAKLVLDRRPRWIKHYFLSDESHEKVVLIEQMLAQQPATKRQIEVRHGDFNELAKALVKDQRLLRNAASFCLLDQHSLECKWETVARLARCNKRGVYKIELFYFFAVGWLMRAIKNQTRHIEGVAAWWGRDDWERLYGGMTADSAMIEFIERLKGDLGYRSVMPWAIHERENSSSRIFYYMIHATDHPEAPALMHRAYVKATGLEPSSAKQTAFDFNAGTPE